MRQAGRYLPDYRSIREQADFFTLCRTPELVSRVTVQPVDQIGVDAAIIFSDILVIPQAMGLDLRMEPGTGPVFSSPVRAPSDIASLRTVSRRDLTYVYDALAQTRTELKGRVPLIGFAGSPWTLLCYMVEGRGSRDFQRPRELALNAPEKAHALLERLAGAVAMHLSEQFSAGADAVQIFDTWGGLLSPSMYREFSLEYIARIIDGLPPNRGPVIVFPKGVHHSYDEIVAAGPDVIGVDWTVNLSEVRRAVADRVAIQGNLDPMILYSDQARIERETIRMLDDYGDGPGHIVNLGHGIRPDTNPERARDFVRAVQNYQTGDRS